MKTVRTAPLIFVIILALTAPAGLSAPIILEAEDYVGSFNVGGDPITVTACSGASGGYAVEGYDTVGDRIDLRVVITQSGDYDDVLRSGGELYVSSSHFLTIRIEGGSTIGFSTYNTFGWGIG